MGSPSRNVQYHPPRLSEDRLNLPQPHSPSLPTHCSGKSGMRPHRLAGRGLRALRHAVRVEVAAGRRIRDVARRIVARGSAAGLRRGHFNQPSRSPSLQRLTGPRQIVRLITFVSRSPRARSRTRLPAGRRLCDVGPHARDLNRQACAQPRLELFAGHRIECRQRPLGRRWLAPGTGPSGPPRRRKTTSAYQGPHDRHRPAAAFGARTRHRSSRSEPAVGHGIRGAASSTLYPHYSFWTTPARSRRPMR